MRAFLAFELTPEVVERLLAVKRELTETKADVKPVSKENMHFTIKFLGEIPEGSVGEIDRRVGLLTLRKALIRVRGVGAFPDVRRPRVVWAGVASEDERKITEIAESVIGALDGIGQTEERRYHAHVTLARVGSPINREAVTKFVLRNSETDFGTTPVEVIKLKSSVLTRMGPTYTDIREYALS